MGILDQYETADQAFRTGKVMTDNNETLLSHLSGLSSLNNINTGTQHPDTIRGITINHILLQRHIDVLQHHITDLNKQNAKIQWWVIALAAAALISTLVQTSIAIATYSSTAQAVPATAPVASQSLSKEVSKAVPTQAATQFSGQATKKNP